MSGSCTKVIYKHKESYLCLTALLRDMISDPICFIPEDLSLRDSAVQLIKDRMGARTLSPQLFSLHTVSG